jgi:RecA/RadA recombinase
MATNNKPSVGKDVLDVFKTLDKQNPEAKFLNESALSTVNKWHDTGCPALNAILSGSLYGGVPDSRITGFSGPSGAGKTYILNKILAAAQKKGIVPIIFDTEAAIDENTTTGVGLDPSGVKYVPVDTVESCRNQLCGLLDNIKDQNMNGRFIVSIDSLGNLASQKELEDIKANKTATDMGLRAKALKSMMRSLTFKAAASGTTILFSNHTYDDPGALFPTMVKNQAGGKGPIYLASILVQLSRKDEKHDKTNDDDVILPEANKNSGCTIGALTVKNRFVPPFLKQELYLNYRTGLGKYSGLLEMGMNHGVLIPNGNNTAFDLNNGKEVVKLGNKKSWIKDSEVWEKLVMPALEKKLKETYSYGS